MSYKFIHPDNLTPEEWNKELKNSFRPMLAAKCKNIDLLHHKFPLLATPKIDGIRCVTRPSVTVDMFDKYTIQALSRTLIAIPNRHIQTTISAWGMANLDGEIITYTNGVMDKYNDVQSKVMSETGTPEFKYMVFDVVTPHEYLDRMEGLKELKLYGHFAPVLPVVIENRAQLDAYEAACLEQGFEGVMLRDMEGPYKFGRSTFNEGWLIKLKRFLDAEATVIGFEELQHNENEATVDNMGLTDRSSHAANMVGGGTLGALLCSGHNGIVFSIGSGFDTATRAKVWANQDNYIGKLVTYKYQPHGQKDKPRCPIFKGFRDLRDMEAPLI